MKDKIKMWYKWGLWTKEMIKETVENSVITKEDYEEITGEKYERV